MRIAGQPDPRYVRVRRRVLAAVGPATLAAAAAVAVVALADGWRTALLAAVAAAALAATRFRFSRQAALCLLAVVVLLALGGWGPGFDSRSTTDRGTALPGKAKEARHDVR